MADRHIENPPYWMIRHIENFLTTWRRPVKLIETSIFIDILTSENPENSS